MPNQVYVDTNCFLHLRDLQDLPWRDLFPRPSLDIVVAPVVIDELDRLKVERAGRVRDRARAALHTIEAASTEPGMRLRLREGPPAIWLVIDPGAAVDWASLPGLDPGRADDQLVAAALSSNASDGAALLSYDSAPLIRARIAGLAAHKSPVTWALPPQKDKAEQDIARLTKELEAARATRPLVSARFVDVGDEGVIRLIVPELPPLPLALRNRLIEAFREEYPRERVNVRASNPYGLNLGIDHISHESANDYYAEYVKFLDRFQKQAADLHTLMQRALTFGEVRYELHNENSVTANNLRTSFLAPKGFVQYRSRSDMAAAGGALPKPKPPSPPRGAFDEIMPLDHSALFRSDKHRDPTGFYWLHRPRGDGAAVLTCAEFRPECVWTDQSFVFGVTAQSGDVVLEVSATNLAKPIRITAPIVYEKASADWSCPAVMRRLPEWIATIIAAF